MQHERLLLAWIGDIVADNLADKRLGRDFHELDARRLDFTAHGPGNFPSFLAQHLSVLGVDQIELQAGSKGGLLIIADQIAVFLFFYRGDRIEMFQQFGAVVAQRF